MLTDFQRVMLIAAVVTHHTLINSILQFIARFWQLITPDFFSQSSCRRNICSRKFFNAHISSHKKSVCTAYRPIVLILSFGKAHKLGKLLVEKQINRIHRAIAVLGNNQFSNIFIFRFRIIVIFAIQKSYDISILLQRT